MVPDFYDRCLGVNQADLTALAYARPDAFRQRFGGHVYRKQLDAAVHFTSTRLDGTVESVDQAVVDEISALPTVHLLSVRRAPGDRIRPTVDLLTSPLRVFMLGQDAARLRADHKAIGDLEELVYRVSPA
jgi:hypothetical protein